LPGTRGSWNGSISAIAKAGRPGAEIKAVARLEALIAMYSETSERLGLLDGRYKQLANEAADEGERRRFLDQATSSYARGMMADLNDYYLASNLSRLLEGSVDSHADENARRQLSGILGAPKELIPPAPPGKVVEQQVRP